jgi:putative transposase
MDNGRSWSLALAQWAEEHGVMLEFIRPASQRKMPLSNSSTGTYRTNTGFLCSEH